MTSPGNKELQRRLCVAPMMDWTDRHCRYFHRLLAPSALLYTEMVTTGAVLHGDPERLLGYNEKEHPLALQLGGSSPADLAECARIAQARGYDEVNLNVGCPSDRVQRRRFGACLMLEPGLVRDCVAAMMDAVDIPVTVKTRVGVDEAYSYNYFSDFVNEVSRSGCRVFIIHARKAWLSGVSPKENREVPELVYDWVFQIKAERPELQIVLNGGVTARVDILQHLQKLDGVMLGRAAYQDPWLLADCHRELYGFRAVADRQAAVLAMHEYAMEQVAAGTAIKNISRHLLGLFRDLPGARRWRRFISENAHKDAANDRLLLQALEEMKIQPGSRLSKPGSGKPVRPRSESVNPDLWGRV